jgi:hypothetical protein
LSPYLGLRVVQRTGIGFAVLDGGDDDDDDDDDSFA